MPHRLETSDFLISSNFRLLNTRIGSPHLRRTRDVSRQCLCWDHIPESCSLELARCLRPSDTAFVRHCVRRTRRRRRRRRMNLDSKRTSTPLFAVAVGLYPTHRTDYGLLFLDIEVT